MSAGVSPRERETMAEEGRGLPGAQRGLDLRRDRPVEAAQQAGVSAGPPLSQARAEQPPAGQGLNPAGGQQLGRARAAGVLSNSRQPLCSLERGPQAALHTRGPWGRIRDTGVCFCDIPQHKTPQPNPGHSAHASTHMNTRVSGRSESC